MSVLLVEDEEADAILWSRWSGVRDYTHVRSIAGARAWLSENTPTEVWVDRQLLDGDGGDFAVEIESRYPDARVVVWSGAPEEGDVAKSRKAVAQTRAEFVTPDELDDVRDALAARITQVEAKTTQAVANLNGRFDVLTQRVDGLSDELGRIAAAQSAQTALLVQVRDTQSNGLAARFAKSVTESTVVAITTRLGIVVVLLVALYLLGNGQLPWFSGRLGLDGGAVEMGTPPE